MTTPQADNTNGLFTGNSSQTTREICEEVHAAFLAKHQLTSWTVAVVPFEHPGLRVTSQEPDGNRRSGVVAKVATFAADLMAFLDEAHAHWMGKRNERRNAAQ
jgi:hypothetical protein